MVVGSNRAEKMQLNFGREVYEVPKDRNFPEFDNPGNANAI